MPGTFSIESAVADALNLELPRRSQESIPVLSSSFYPYRPFAAENVNEPSACIHGTGIDGRIRALSGQFCQWQTIYDRFLCYTCFQQRFDLMCLIRSAQRYCDMTIIQMGTTGADCCCCTCCAPQPGQNLSSNLHMLPQAPQYLTFSALVLPDLGSASWEGGSTGCLLDMATRSRSLASDSSIASCVRREVSSCSRRFRSSAYRIS
jgi:hypothetical protein